MDGVWCWNVEQTPDTPVITRPYAHQRGVFACCRWEFSVSSSLSSASISGCLTFFNCKFVSFWQGAFGTRCLDLDKMIKLWSSLVLAACSSGAGRTTKAGWKPPAKTHFKSVYSLKKHFSCCCAPFTTYPVWCTVAALKRRGVHSGRKAGQKHKIFFLLPLRLPVEVFFSKVQI